MRTRKGLVILTVCSLLFGCQAVQEQTNKEAPYQTKQKEGRQELLQPKSEKD